MRHSIAHARRHGQPKCRSQSKRNALYAFVIGAGFGSIMVNTAYALPGTPTIVNSGPAGNNATFDTSVPNTLTVNQLVPNLAITWTASHTGSTPNKAFDILTGETVTFVQPSTASIAWNQISCNGCSATQIAGTLQSQLAGSPGTVGGKVWLFDPNGIAITSGGVVNVGGLVASSLTGDPAAWLANATPETTGFQITDGGGATPTNGAVTNAGSITAGYVALAGNSVDNASGGTITVGFGTIDLAAGRVATVTPLAGGGLNFALDLTSANALANNNTAGVNNAVANEGSLTGAAVTLTANDANAIFATAVNTSGIIRAVQLSNQGGTITLNGIGDPVQASGTLNSAGTTGTDPVGTVQITGDSLSFGATAVTGALTATSTVGDITELTSATTGVVEGAAGTFDSAGNIDLSTAANDLKNPTFTVGGANLGYRDINSIVMPATTLTGNLKLISDTGTITETATTGILTVGGTSSFTTQTAQAGTAIDLSTNTNLLTGAVALNTAGTDDAKVTNGKTLVLAGSTVGGAITAVTTVGDIAETGAVVEGTAGAFNAAGNINLGTQANNLKNPTFTVGGTNLAYRDVNSIVMPATTLTGTLNLVSDTGTITEGGVVNVGGNSSFTTSTAQAGTAIDLSTSTNVLGGTVALNTAGTDGAAIKAQALDFAASTVGGNLTATATTGTITESGTLTVGGTSSFTTSTAQAGTAIDLSTNTNQLTGAVALNTAGTDGAKVTNGKALVLAASNVGGAITALTTVGDITETGAVTEGTAGTFNAAGNINLGTQANNLKNPTFTVGGANLSYRDVNSILIPATTLSGTLNLVSDTGTITEGGVLSVTGTSSFTTSTAQAGTAIDLSSSANQLTGAVTLTTAGTDGAKVTNGKALVLAASTVGGAITALTTVGDITETGAVVEGTAGSFNAAGNVNLGTAANNLKGPTFAGTGGNVAYRDVNSIVMPATTVTGTLNLVSDTGTITESGPLTVSGISSFMTSAPQGGTAIDLSTSTNQLTGAVTLTTAGTDGAKVTNGKPLVLAASTVGGAINAVTTAGDITEAGAVVEGAGGSFNAAGNVNLGTAANNLKSPTFAATGGNVTYRDVNAIVMPATTLTGTLALTSDTGAVSQSGALNVTGTSSFSGTGITLNSANTLGGTVVLNTAGSAAITAAALDFAASTVGGNLTATSTGAVSQTGALNVTGTSSFSG
ncbi:MAG TPA: filamentous hemagglutinin N-terminal domain-containing protein, partial [Steroidobacteraceae bacterium]|nr:filamentous hemagglutinin N-terminal domain-containing protein [Steroidobacteraceae bacterium]